MATSGTELKHTDSKSKVELVSQDGTVPVKVTSALESQQIEVIPPHGQKLSTIESVIEKHAQDLTPPTALSSPSVLWRPSLLVKRIPSSPAVWRPSVSNTELIETASSLPSVLWKPTLLAKTTSSSSFVWRPSVSNTEPVETTSSSTSVWRPSVSNSELVEKTSSSSSKATISGLKAKEKLCDETPLNKVKTLKSKKKISRKSKAVFRPLEKPTYNFPSTWGFVSPANHHIIARMDRIMGSDKVRLFDDDYHEKYLKGMQAEELAVWEKSRNARMAKETKRYRSMAFKGYMKPTAEMTDIYTDPMYKVDKAMQHMNKTDYTYLRQVNHTTEVPPLTLKNPFLYDDSGKAFKKYPRHVPFKIERLRHAPVAKPEKPVEDAFLQYQERLEKLTTDFDYGFGALKYKKSVKDYWEGSFQTPEPSPPVKVEDKKEVKDEEQDVGVFDLDPIDSRSDIIRDISLSLLKQKYKMEDVDIKAVWEHLQHQLIFDFDAYCAWDEFTGQQLMDLSEQFVGVFNREVILAEEACGRLAKTLDEHMKYLSPVDTSDMPQTPPELVVEDEDIDD